MKPMNNFHYLLDVKLSIAGLLFLAISYADLELGLKIIGSILFIGFTIRRWYLLEKRYPKNNDED